MKFEKFMKSVGVHGLVLKDDGGNDWLWSCNVMAMIPSGATAIAKGHNNMPEKFQVVLDAFDDCNYAELFSAKLPFPEAKAKDILRIYRSVVDRDVEIEIDNRDWAMIESGDGIRIYENADGEAVALIVVSGYGDDATPIMVIFTDDYLTNNK